MKKHFETLTIKQFRGLQESELSQLGRVNLLVGPNNSGKTSILEAISAYCSPLDPLKWLNVAWHREIRSSRIPMPDALKWLFPQSVDSDPELLYEGKIILSATGNFPILEVSADYREILGTDPAEDEESLYGSDDIRRGADVTLKAVRNDALYGSDEFSENFQIWENERFVKHKVSNEHDIPVASITPFSHRVEQIRVRQFTDTAFQQMSDDVIALARQIDGGIRRMQILDKTGMRSALYIEHDKTGISPISAFGDGLRRTLAIALNLALARNGILLIDEIETSIHVSALKTVFQWLVKSCEKFSVQLFATTHSLEAIDAILSLDRESKKDLVAYRLPSPETNGKIKRFGEDLLYRLRYERGMDVR